MIIKRLVERDLAALIPFMIQTWQQNYEKFCEEEVQVVESVFTFEKVLKEMQNPYNVFFGAFDANGQLRGYATILLEENKSFLDKIYVDESFKGQGVGKALLRSCFQEVYNANISSVGLEVDQSNINAIAFYEKYGFKRHPIKRLYPSTHATLYYDVIMICTEVGKSLELLKASRSLPHNEHELILKI